MAKQYDAVLPYIEEHRLDAWTHNKAIQKAISNIDEEDVLLYVDKFAVNLKSGELMEKTRCVVKI